MLGYRRYRAMLLGAAALCVAVPATAQDVQGGRVAASSAGTVGERQTRDQAAPNVMPTKRLSSRIANRVQSRIRNRIDRFYSPQANTSSPFEAAEERARTAGRRSPR